jgi:hypothetical protein
VNPIASLGRDVLAGVSEPVRHDHLRRTPTAVAVARDRSLAAVLCVRTIARHAALSICTLYERARGGEWANAGTIASGASLGDPEQWRGVAVYSFGTLQVGAGRVALTFGAAAPAVRDIAVTFGSRTVAVQPDPRSCHFVAMALLDRAVDAATLRFRDEDGVLEQRRLGSGR